MRFIELGSPLYKWSVHPANIRYPYPTPSKLGRIQRFFEHFMIQLLSSDIWLSRNIQLIFPIFSRYLTDTPYLKVDFPLISI